MSRLRIPLFSATEPPCFLDVDSADLKTTLDEHALRGFYRAYDPRLDAAVAARRLVQGRRLAAKKREWAANKKKVASVHAQLDAPDPVCEPQPRSVPKRQRKMTQRYTY